MSHLLVLASTDSRLHADLLIVRLRRAGIATESVSVFHPTPLRPNSTVCWIRGAANYSLSSGEAVTVAGSLGRKLVSDKRKLSSFLDSLQSLGFSHEQSLGIEEKLLENYIIIAAEVIGESDLRAIYHTFNGLTVETVRITDNRHVVADKERHRRMYASTKLPIPETSPA
jgi:hypothetical protein